MMADFALVMILSVPVILLGLAIGVRFATGVPGMVLFVVLAGCWGVAFTGLPYSIALKTGNPAAVNSSFILFFPFVFLTTAFAPLPAPACGRSSAPRPCPTRWGAGTGGP